MTRKRFIPIAILMIIAFVIAAVLLLTDKPAKSSAAAPRYLVSLGDSVAAGDGLPVDAETSSGAYASCDRSKEAYPVLLAKELDVTLKQFACSGATIDAAINQSQFTGVPPQLTAAKSFIAGSDVVINVGINDINGLSLVAQCARATTCVTAEQQATLDAAMTQLQSNYSQLLSAVRAEKPKHIVVNTYYGLLDKADTCFENYGIDGPKIAQINKLEADLNSMISETAREGGATVVNVDFSGHTLCNGTPWIQGLLDKAPLHPTADGQKQITKQDAAALR